VLRGTGTTTIYFDSCVYIAHYRQEITSYGQTRISAINETLKDSAKGALRIMTSSISICEVIDQLLLSGMTTEIEDFKTQFKIGAQDLIDVDPIISERAARYRDYYRNNPVKPPNRNKAFKNLATPDALHLATAKLYGADEFWTFDGLSLKPDKRESIKPLWLNNKVGHDSLIITAPALPQGTLLLLPPVNQPTSAQTPPPQSPGTTN
jgi:predicted nucleic acid-binding protein